jgi:tetratricopeptide (TPR) repeat protein
MNPDQKECPRCTEVVKTRAAVCRFCGYEFTSPPASASVSISPVADMPAAPVAIEESEVLDLLQALVEKSLVVYEQEENGSGRYRLLEMVRQYAQERLAQTQEPIEFRVRHRDFFLAWAERIGPFRILPPHPERMAVEHENLRAALGFCRETEEGAQAGLRLFNTIATYLRECGYGQELRQCCAEVLRHPGITPTPAWWDARLAEILLGPSPYPPEARPVIEAALASYCQTQDRTGEAYALWILGSFHGSNGQPDEAVACYETALEVLRTTDEQGMMPNILACLGNDAYYRRDYERALALFEECLARDLQRGQTAGRVYNFIAMVALELGDYDRVQATLVQAVTAYATGNTIYLVEALLLLVRLAAVRQQWERAARLLGASNTQSIAFFSTPLNLSKPGFFNHSLKPNEIESVKTALGQEVYEAAYAEGLAITRAQAVAYALQDTETDTPPDA